LELVRRSGLEPGNRSFGELLPWMKSVATVVKVI